MQPFVGALQMAVAEARVHTTRLDQNFDPAAANMLANALSDKRSYTEALVLYQKVLKFTQQRVGPDHCCPDHLDVAKTQNNIAIIFQQQGKYSEALEMYQKSLATKEKVLGPEHPDVASTYNK